MLFLSIKDGLQSVTMLTKYLSRAVTSSTGIFSTLFERFCPVEATCTRTRKLSGSVRKVGENMAIRLVQFQLSKDESPRVGVELEDGGNVVDVTNIDEAIPKDMRSFLESWDSSLSATLR